MTRNAYFGVPLVARAGVTEFEFQRDATWSIHMDRAARRFEASHHEGERNRSQRRRGNDGTTTIAAGPARRGPNTEFILELVF